MIRAFLRDRIPLDRNGAMMAGGVSFAHVFGTVLVFLLGIQVVTGIALAAFYSPSATDAWASVAYIQDQASLGWLVRGLHYHGGSALVIVAGIHLLQTAIAGAYKQPREIVWWLGVVLLVLLIAWSITGYWLRWDQAGYWASQVEIGIAAGTPVVGGAIRAVAIGGNEPGNLTLTRAYAMHVVALPVLVTLLTVFHIWLARRHGTTPMRVARNAVPRWPQQTLRDVIAMAIVFAVLLAVVIVTGGADLAAPADPTQAYDARPLWPVRWLFELRVLAGSAEQLVAMAAPAVVGGFLVALPLLDHGMERRPRKRKLWLGALAGLFAMIGALTVASFTRDANDPELAKRQATSEVLATRARKLAVENGVPVTGALDVFKTARFWTARTLFASRCANCHDADSKERKGPVIAPGHGDRAWLLAFLKAPSADQFWGRTKFAKAEAAMKPVELSATDLADLVEMLYAESGAEDLDIKKRDRGLNLFESACTDCHARDEGSPGAAGPSLAGLGSRSYYLSVISNPKSALHMGPANSEMPRFDRELTVVERDALAEYLVWLRTASTQDLIGLGPL
ncbi:MAG: Cytochrome b/b6 domain protein [Myxococcales bacterium]|nr:Cytochrome b/b6 domain protein [Myxococcales bacterium]